MNRREFLAAIPAAVFSPTPGHASAPFPVKFRQQPQYFPALSFVEPGSDEFPGEKIAMETEARLREAMRTGQIPSDSAEILAAWREWRDSLGKVRDARFFRLPGDRVRYVIRAERGGRLEYRTGHWKQSWSNGRLTHFERIEESQASAGKPWFRDVTAEMFEGEPSFSEQLSRGVPYWRARLDPACGIDVYGQNGIAVADIDGDGVDEVYVSQPGGLPNRLYKLDGSGRFRDISREAGLDLLDDTACALFADLRNSGHQDLVLVRTNQPLLFFNDGKGRFTRVPDPFRFATAPQGSFTSVAAADFDRDGRLDLYFCCYVYYQSEAQYRYPVPYHDARNGPPNFLFRNRLDQAPGYFEDVTASTGMDHNNNRFSFAATWCDYNGDGWPDLYVTNDFGSKNLYRNTKGHFEDVAEQAGVVDLGPGMSAAWLDYDGDGRPDLLVSNMWSACGQRVVNDPAFGPVSKDPSLLEPYRRHVKGNSLYHNNGDGTFTYTGDKEGIEIVPWSWSCDGCDFDNDGVPELYIASGMLTNNDTSVDLMSYFYRQVVAKSPVKAVHALDYENGWNAINQLVRQDHSWAAQETNMFFVRRDGRYRDYSGVSGIDKAEDSRAFAFMDFDGDGNVDLILKSRMGPQVRVFQNECGVARKTIVFALRGTKSNRDAIGARVEVDGQVKWLAAGSAYLSQHTKRMHFGLADRQRVGKVRIQWPSGEVQEVGPLDAGFLYEMTEGSADIRSKPLRKHLGREERPVTADNRARLHTTWLWEPVPLPEKRRGPALFVVHAGETLPQLSVPMEALDLRGAHPDIAAAYAIFRRYLFDYRVDLETPLWLLIDAESRVRKVYAAAPDDAAAVRADLRSMEAAGLPDPRGLPFPGHYTGSPRRDYYKFGGALLQAGYPEQALPYLQEMLRRSPDNPKALMAVGRIHLLANRLPLARAALERAVAVDPRLATGWNELGGVEAAVGNWKEALRLYEKALALEPDLPYALINAAHAHEQLENAAEAERLYRRALVVDPRNGEAANGLGLLLAKQGQTADARKLFELAISIRRDDSTAVNNLGVLFLNLGQQNDAIAAFQYGIQIAPDDDVLYLNLARVWVRMGNRDKARELMRDLLSRKPGNAIAQRALKELEQQ